MVTINTDKTESRTEDADKEAAIEEATREAKHNEINLKIAHCAERLLPYLDLCASNLNELPPEVYNLSHIQMLYLEGNLISSLPDDFFSYFPLVRWMDLRNNCLTTVPLDIALHNNLEVLLLQDNSIAELPHELGLCMTLRAITLSENPLTYPPEEIIAQGTNVVKEFLWRRNQDETATSATGESQNMDFMRDELHHDEMSVKSEEQPVRKISLKAGAGPQPLIFHQAQMSLVPGGQIPSEVGAISTSGAKLHEPITHYQIRQQYMERMSRGAGAQRKHQLVHRTQSERHNMLVNMQPEPPGVEAIERRLIDEKRSNRRREIQDKQEAILQRRRDHESLKDWREQGKRLQYQKYMEQMQKTRSKISHESEQRIESGPFDVGRKDLRLPNSEQHRVQSMTNINPEDRPKPLSPEALAIADHERRAKEAALREKIQQHSKEIYSRKAQPKGDPKNDLEVAQRNMQIMHMLRRAITSPSCAFF